MGFPLSFFIIIKLNNFFLQILLQDKYNIGALTVYIEFMWPHKFYIYRQYTNIVYLL